MKNILVTGSSGLIGTRLCEFLLKEGFNVIGVDCVSNKWQTRINDLTINIDLRDKNGVMENLPKNIDMIIHLAANARVYDLIEKPQLAMDNFSTLFNILEFARVNNIEKLIFSSSREVYGNSNKEKYIEDNIEIKNCESPYAASKIGGEPLIVSYNKCYGLDYLIFRFSNVYGMYDESDRVIPLFIKKCKTGEDLEIFGKDKILDFTHVDDVVSGLVIAISMFDNIKNDIYNLASGQGVSIVDLAEIISKKIGANNKIKILGNRVGEVVKFVADINKAKEKLGFNPVIDIEKGVGMSIDWYLNNLYK